MWTLGKFVDNEALKCDVTLTLIYTQTDAIILSLFNHQTDVVTKLVSLTVQEH